MNRITSFTITSVFCLALFSGCSKQVPLYDASSPGTSMPEGHDIEYNPVGPGVITEEIGPQVETLDATGDYAGVERFDVTVDPGSAAYEKNNGRSSRGLKPIYFDFDQASIRNDEIATMENNSDYLKGNPSLKVVVEGNCDERGTSEYNIALGERRALNAKNYLTQLGVEEYRVRTVSYGEEQSLFTENDEYSWSQNRRDDFVVE